MHVELFQIKIIIVSNVVSGMDEDAEIDRLSNVSEVRSKVLNVSLHLNGIPLHMMLVIE